MHKLLSHQRLVGTKFLFVKVADQEMKMGLFMAKSSWHLLPVPWNVHCSALKGSVKFYLKSEATGG